MKIKLLLIKNFPNVKFLFTEQKRDDVINIDSQIELVQLIHNRAHRNYRNNLLELAEKYFWPSMRNDCRNFATKCKICLTEKYERHPTREKVSPTPIPLKPGESVQMDVFHLAGKMFISTLDRYSKYCHLREIPNKINTYSYIEEIFTQIYPNCETLMTDNENIFNSLSAKALYDRLEIEHVTTPLAHSTTNSQVERVHSTILEIANSLANENSCETLEQLFKSVKQYNNTIL